MDSAWGAGARGHERHEGGLEQHAAAAGSPPHGLRSRAGFNAVVAVPATALAVSGVSADLKKREVDLHRI